MKFKLKLPTLKSLKHAVDFSAFERMDRDQYRLWVIVLAGVILLMSVGGLTAFFLSLKGEEQTLVPEVRGVELAQGLIKLQEKELYPRIALRFTDNPAERGTIVEQKPPAGAIVKAGRRIQLVVSRGPVVDRVEDFRGRHIDEVKLHLQTLFASNRPLLSIADPPIYTFSESPAGTILEQKPLPDTEISGPIVLDFVVSRGPEKAKLEVPALMGMSLPDAIRALEKAKVPAVFAARKAQAGEKAGFVLSQDPAAGSFIEQGGKISLSVTLPQAEKGMLAGLFTKDLPAYPYPLKLRLEAQSQNGDKSIILSGEHPGGAFSAPYLVREGTVLILSVLDQEVARMEVRTP